MLILLLADRKVIPYSKHMSTSPKPFAFVLMPFSKDFDDAFDLAIRPACDAAGAYAERVDKQIFTGSILERVYNQIAKADLVVADMSERNPNVFYEVGYAHALGKTTLLLTRNAEDIPFDLKHYPHIVYANRLTDLRRELEQRVRWHLENPEKTATTSSSVRVRVNGTSLVDRPTVKVPILKGSNRFRLTVELQNRVERSLRTIACKIGVFAPAIFIGALGRGRDSCKSIEVEDGRRLFLPIDQISLLPEAWDAIVLAVSADKEIEPGKFEFEVRVFLESGCVDYPFTVEVATEFREVG